MMEDEIERKIYRMLIQRRKIMEWRKEEKERKYKDKMMLYLKIMWKEMDIEGIEILLKIEEERKEEIIDEKFVVIWFEQKMIEWIVRRQEKKKDKMEVM